MILKKETGTGTIRGRMCKQKTQPGRGQIRGQERGWEAVELWKHIMASAWPGPAAVHKQIN